MCIKPTCGRPDLFFGILDVAVFFTLLDGLEALLTTLGAIGRALHQFGTDGAEQANRTTRV